MPQRTAILIGNQVFRDDSGLAPLRGPHNDVARLSEILGDQQRGNFAVRTFLDQPHYEILPVIDEILGSARPGDLVLIYYSGHGKLDRAGRVCLATASTRATALQATSIPALDIKRLVDQSDCDQVVLLLDCCYSGALDDLRGADVASEMRVIEDAQGFYILTASTGLQAAREEASVSGGAVMGKFTHALVDGIETGASDVARKGRIMLSDLRQHLEKVVSGQTPQYFARQAHGDPLISLSPSTAAPLLDPAIVIDLEASNWHHRAGAVTYLVNTLQSGIPAARQAARALLERRLPDERDVDVRRQIEQGLSSAASPGPSIVQPPNDPVGSPKPAPAKTRWKTTSKATVATVVRISNKVAAVIGFSMLGLTVIGIIVGGLNKQSPPKSTPVLTQTAPTTTIQSGPPGALEDDQTAKNVDWFVGKWTAIDDTCARHMTISREQNNVAWIGDLECPSLAGSLRPPVHLTFDAGMLKGQYLIRPARCPSSAGSGLAGIAANSRCVSATLDDTTTPLIFVKQ